MKYICGIHFLSSKEKIDSQDPNVIPQDLNEGSEGNYIYAVK